MSLTYSQTAHLSFGELKSNFPRHQHQTLRFQLSPGVSQMGFDSINILS